ncbi:MAG: RNA polymerase sigma factor [Gammaproteobacteria bacterium]|nr:RNA polymerase sigma factor [Gammaproteobacteria bacterium]
MSQRQALDAFLASIGPRALTHVSYGLANRADAEDIVQNAMIKFVQHYAEKPEAQWTPLFFKVLYTQKMDFFRKTPLASALNRVKHWLSTDGVDEMDSQADDSQPDLEMELSDAGEQLEQRLNVLPERQREALMLRVWEGLDVKQTALAMRCSEGSVKTHLSRAMQTLNIGGEN